MNKMNPWLNAVSVINGLVKYSQIPSRAYKITRSSYPGLNNIPVPAFDIEPLTGTSSMTIILYHGASPFAEEHPGMITLGQAMANGGIKVHIPRLPLLKELEITSQNVEWIAHHLNWFRNVKENKNKTIIPAGISFSGGLLLKALLHPLIKPSPPKSVFTYGTYFDFQSSIKFLLTGEINYNRQAYKISPNDWGLIVLFHNYLKFIDPGFDTVQMREILKLRVQNEVEESEKALLLLPDDQQNLLRNIFSAHITSQIETLAEKMINACEQEIIEMSPAHWGNQIKTPVFIMHGTNDSMIPFTESILLAECMENSHLFISNMYEHREITSKSGYLMKLYNMLKLTSFFKNFIKFNAN